MPFRLIVDHEIYSPQVNGLKVNSLPIYHLQSISEISVYFQINNIYRIDILNPTSDFHLVTTQLDRNIVFAQILKYFYDNEYARRQKIWLMRL